MTGMPEKQHHDAIRERICDNILEMLTMLGLPTTDENFKRLWNVLISIGDAHWIQTKEMKNGDTIKI